VTLEVIPVFSLHFLPLTPCLTDVVKSPYNFELSEFFSTVITAEEKY
jgi:hypothetical protein